LHSNLAEICARDPPRVPDQLPTDGRFVFASFNGWFKADPILFAAWMEILRGVEGSVLWLLDWGGVGGRFVPRAFFLCLFCLF
jgi:predicted O-linked N-acetylglucosamine transferase (SPINDLY family)